MKPRHQVSRAAIELIERFEGYRAKAAQLPDGRWTIGYGHTLTARKGAEVSADDAEALLLYDLIAIAHAVNELSFTPLTQNQFDALCAFAFNLGLEKFRGSKVLKRLNEGQLIQAACEMELWRKAEFEGEAIVIDALVRRRAAEKALFLTPAGGAWTPAPSAVLKPQVDEGAATLVPAETPTEVVTTLEGERVLVLREGEPAPEPLAPAEDESPLAAVAEAVTGRLATIFPEAAEDFPPAPEPAPAEPEVIDEPASEPEPAAEPEFALETAEPAPEAPDVVEADAEPDLLEPSPDAFEPANDPEAAADLLQPEAAEAEPAPEAPVEAPVETPVEAVAETVTEAPPAPPAEAERERVIIDDTVPYEFVPAPVVPVRTRSAEGYLSLAVMVVLGLAFFAGGLFWATYAQPGAGGGLLTPKVVGGLASVAGVGLGSIAVYLILQRLGRAAERNDDLED